jgi:hypothetical protein
MQLCLLSHSSFTALCLRYEAFAAGHVHTSTAGGHSSPVWEAMAIDPSRYQGSSWAQLLDSRRPCRPPGLLP